MIKKILFLSLLTAYSVLATAQNQKFIEVVGSAEMEVVPNEIEFTMTVVDGKLDKVLGVLKNYGIFKSDIKFNNSGYDYYHWWYWWWYNREWNQFSFTLKEDVEIFEMLKDLEKSWVSHFAVSKRSHTKLVEYRKKVKIEAIKAAKEKANYLLDAIDEKLGGVLEIEEINEDKNEKGSRLSGYHPYWGWGHYIDNYQNNSNLMSNSNVSIHTGSSGQSQSNSNENKEVKSIKLRYEVRAKFQIES